MKSIISRAAKPLSMLVLTACVATSALAQGVKIGAVNVDRIMRDSAMAKSITAKLEQDFSKREKELQNQLDALKKAFADFERTAPTLPESQRVSKQRSLVEEERELQRKQRAFHEDLALRKNEGVQLVIEKVNKVLKTMAEEEKYDLIIQEAAYINPKLDITERVIDRLNDSK
ncbi:OmpH family outer membrane protein [Hydrogenophaga sp. 5NK40-0174]|uniref:OmpH family outer membrane protein n=1 Tax=Hydrogenophaga sp. 5NK40-0174 TaxID=3127649 RepID=UPI003102056C